MNLFRAPLIDVLKAVKYSMYCKDRICIE